MARRRPVALVAPSAVQVEHGAPGAVHPVPQPAPYAAAQVPVIPDTATEVALVAADGARLAAVLDGEGVQLVVGVGGSRSTHRSRRHGRPSAPVTALAATLTGTHLTAFTREGDRWVARARVDLADRMDTRDERWLASLGATGSGPLTAGGFGQLGLRDLRLVTHADGTAYRSDGALLLTASSAGPGFFDTGHTSVWRLDPATLRLEHAADLFFRRPDRPGAYGDHATHLVRDQGCWLVATSTWGDFDRAAPDASVRVTLARSDADLLTGRHLLDTEPLALPTDGLRSVGVWDPHLVRTGDGWLVGYVSATRFFSFHPVLAAGPALDRLTVRGAATGRRATEGTTLVRLDGEWRVLASDGRDNPRGLRERYPVLDLDLREVGTLDAPYPTNIPWPTLVPPEATGAGWLLVAFDGTPYGGRLPGYGTHGRVVLMRAASSPPGR